MTPAVRYRTGYKYVTVENCRFSVPSLAHLTVRTDYFTLVRGVLSINRGYAWDGPSGPLPDLSELMVPSLVHDCLYQMLREGLIPYDDRYRVDIIFRRMCVERGVWRWLATLFLKGLTEFGDHAATVGRPIKRCT